MVGERQWVTVTVTRHSRRHLLALAGGAAIAGCLGGPDDGETTAEDDGDGSDAATDDSETAEDDSDATDGEPSVGNVTLLLNWQLSGLHAPYVAARENGFYAEEGFSAVEIESGDGSDFAANQAGLGNVEFAISSADQVLNVNSRGLSPRCVGVMMQRNPNVVFATRDGFGELTDPEQLEGATVGSGPGMVRQMTEAYLDYHGILDTVEYVDAGFDTVQQLLEGEIDAAGGAFSDVVDAEHQGAEVDVLAIEEAIPSYGHLIVTDEAFAAENGPAVEAFLRATARGTAWAIENPDAAIDHLVEVQPELEEVRENQVDKWERMYEGYVLSETVTERGWGYSNPDSWGATHETLEAGGVLEDEVDPDAVWTNDYLDDEYEYIGAFDEQIDA